MWTLAQLLEIKDVTRLHWEDKDRTRVDVTDFLDPRLQDLLQYSGCGVGDMDTGTNCFAFALAYLGFVKANRDTMVYDVPDPNLPWSSPLVAKSCSEYLKECMCTKIAENTKDISDVDRLKLKLGDVLMFGTLERPEHMAVVLAIEKRRQEVRLWVIERKGAGCPIGIRPVEGDYYSNSPIWLCKRKDRKLIPLFPRYSEDVRF